jgi:hypothetical protein
VSVILKQLDAIDAQIELLRVMVAGIRHGVSAPRAEEAPRLETCEGTDDEFCGRRNPGAINLLGAMGGNPQRMCRGCGLDPVTGQKSK